MRFDNTNPAKSDKVMENAIMDDVEWITGERKEATYASDYFDECLTRAETMIKNGDAYTDDTSQEEMQNQRMHGLPSKNRDLPVEEVMAQWEQMKAGKPGTCLRAKISVDDPNKCLRDPVMYRVTEGLCMPTYDYSCPIVDSKQGVTHALRTTEYNDRNAMYIWMAEKSGVPCPAMQTFARLSMQYTVMSKRKLAEMIKLGYVESWEDPRMPTIRGLRRRGVQREALIDFVKQSGFSQNINVSEWQTLWSINKQLLEKQCPRLFAVGAASVPLVLTNATDLAETVEAAKHPQIPDMGARPLFRGGKLMLEKADAALLKEGQEFSLMTWTNVIVDKIVKDDSGAITAIEATLRTDTKPEDFKKTMKLSWLADAEDKVKCTFTEYDHVLAVPSVDKSTKVDDSILRGQDKTKFVVEGYAEAFIKTIEPKSCVQFMRRGFYYLDNISEDGVYNWTYIPDGLKKPNHLSPMSFHGVTSIEATNDTKAIKEAKKKAAAAPKKEADDATAMDMRVGKIVAVKRHPDAESLYVSQINVGDEEPRQIVSGLVKFVKEEDMLNRMVVVWCNLKPSKLRGLPSAGMVLCVSDDPDVVPIAPPAGAEPGERITFPPLEGIGYGEKHLTEKKAKKLMESLHTNGDSNVAWGDAVFTCAAGPVKGSKPDAPVR